MGWIAQLLVLCVNELARKENKENNTQYSTTHILCYHPFIKHYLQNVRAHVTLLGKLSNKAPLRTEDAAWFNCNFSTIVRLSSFDFFK
jgi:hypothetical protein